LNEIAMIILKAYGVVVIINVVLLLALGVVYIRGERRDRRSEMTEEAAIRRAKEILYDAVV